MPDDDPRFREIERSDRFAKYAILHVGQLGQERRESQNKYENLLEVISFLHRCYDLLGILILTPQLDLHPQQANHEAEENTEGEAAYSSESKVRAKWYLNLVVDG